jgi:hypothetical protein
MIEPTKMQNKLICLVKTAVYELENYVKDPRFERLSEDERNVMFAIQFEKIMNKAISDTFEPNNGGES